MTSSDDERVSDILDACHKLSEIAALGRSEYDKSWIVQSAVERQLEIIGEAATHLSDEFLGDDVEADRHTGVVGDCLGGEQHARYERDAVQAVVANGERLPCRAQQNFLMCHEAPQAD